MGLIIKKAVQLKKQKLKQPEDNLITDLYVSNYLALHS